MPASRSSFAADSPRWASSSATINPESVPSDPVRRGQSEAAAGAGDDDGAGAVRVLSSHQSRVTPCIGEYSG